MKSGEKLLYEYSDAKHALDMSKSERRRHIKSFTAIWLLACMLLLSVWCIANFVLDLRRYGHSATIKNYVMPFVVLGVILLITALSVFGLWGVFMRKVSAFYRPRERETRREMEEMQSEFEAADENKDRENALMIYDDRIVIKRNGEERVLDRNELSVCTMSRWYSGIFLRFFASDGEKISANLILPTSDAYLLKKYLGDKVLEVNSEEDERLGGCWGDVDGLLEKLVATAAERSASKRKRAKSESAEIETGALVAGLLCIVVGIAVALLGSFHVMGDMPSIAIGFPIGLGVLFLVLAFHRYEIVNVFLLTFTVAALFIFMGLLFLFAIGEETMHSPVTVRYLLRHPTADAIVCLFFVSLGISFIPGAIKSLIEYIRHR